MLCRNVGILGAYTIGAFTSYYTQPFIYAVVPILFFLMFILLPNTPQYYLRKDKFEVSSDEYFDTFTKDANVFNELIITNVKNRKQKRH